jgi:hypothetical protein
MSPETKRTIAYLKNTIAFLESNNVEGLQCVEHTLTTDKTKVGITIKYIKP